MCQQHCTDPAHPHLQPDVTKLLTIAEAADRLRVSVRTIEREARDGRIAIVRIRSIRLVAPAELERYIAAQTEIQNPSAASATAGRSASDSVLATVSREFFRPRPVATTRGRSRLRSAVRVNGRRHA